MSQPDLSGGVLPSPSSLAPGDTLTVSYSVFNTGSAGSGSTTDRLYLSRDSTISPDDTLIATRSVPSIASSGLAYGAIDFVIPANYATGTYYLLSSIDPDNNVSESDEGNNTSSFSFTVTALSKPDLSGGVLPSPSSLAAGDMLTVSYSVFNTGSAASGTTSELLYLSRDSTISADDTLIAMPSIPSVAPSGQTSGAVSFVIPANYATGTYYLLSSIDPGNNVNESDEGNNTSSFSFTVTASSKPDLSGGVLPSPSSLSPGDTLTVSYSVFNTGSAASGATTDRLYLSKDSAISVDDTLIAMPSIPSVAPSGQTFGTVNFVIPANYATGTYYLLSSIDPDNSVNESDEGNNSSSFSFEVTPSGNLIDYTDGANHSNAVVLTSNGTQLQVLAGSAEQSGVISQDGGTFGLEKTGDGTLVLSADNSFTGDVTVSAGTLQVGSPVVPFTFGGLQSNNIKNNAQIVFRPGSSGPHDYDGVISGTGSFQVDFATIIFGGANTYTGSMTLNYSGLLVVSSDNNLGAASAPLIFDGGLLQLGGAFNFNPARPIVTQDTTYGGINLNGFDTTISQAITGSGQISITGTGTLTLSGANQYAGGTTIVGNTLRISADNRLPIAGKVSLFAATLDLQNHAQSIGTLWGDKDSTVALGSGQLTSDLIFDSTYLGAFTGTGRFTKTGNGTLTLSGNSGSFAGSLAVAGGAIVVSQDSSLGGPGASLIFDGGTLRTDSRFDTVSHNFVTDFTINPARGITLNAGGGTIDTYFSTTIGSNITGSGSFTAKASSGAVISLTGANTYTGGTTITSGGTLQIGNGGTTGSITGNVIDNGILAFNRAYGPSTDFAGIISGTGSVTEAGVAVLGLSGNNSYTGGTLIKSGALYITRDYNLGDVHGGLTFDGGRIFLDASFFGGISSSRAITLNAGGGTFAGYGILTLSQGITGVGSLTVDGGSLTLTGANSYTGGTIVSSGGLNIGNGTTSGFITGNVAIDTNGVLQFNQHGNYTFGGLVSGTGSFFNQSSSTLTLTGDSSFTGTTGSSIGALQFGNGGTTGSVAGIIRDNASLIFNRSNTDIVNNDILGSGTLIQAGTGNLVLGDLAHYQGEIDINKGTLTFGGIAYSTYLKVASGATMAGVGTVGVEWGATVASGGTLAPGDHGVGKLNVNGPLLLDSGSVYAADVAPSAADQLAVGGAVTIAGNLTASFAAGDYAIGAKYTLLTSTGALSGSFANIQTTGLAPGLAAHLSYDAHDVYLTIAGGAPTPHDIDGDGKADLAWRNNDGTAVIYFMNGGTVLSAAGLGNPGTAWKVKSTDDLNGDGKSDLVWQNDDGTGAVWLMNGATVTSQAGLGNPGAAWKIKATGDLNGDGKSDIVWQNTDGTAVVYFMNGSTISSIVGLGNPGAAWNIRATGDFNGDGKSDILWQNNDGTVVTWLMNGSTVTSAPGVGNPGTAWHIRDTADFNGDGKSDILWQNDDGTTVIWFMNGAAVTSAGGVGNPGAAWHIEGTGDVNGDGKADITWHNDDGTTTIWLMNGSTVTGYAGLGNPGSSWHVVTG